MSLQSRPTAHVERVVGEDGGCNFKAVLVFALSSDIKVVACLFSCVERGFGVLFRLIYNAAHASFNLRTCYLFVSVFEIRKSVPSFSCDMFVLNSDLVLC
jgi:hypothetical protein